MIKKERKEPLILRQLLALKTRLPSNHPILMTILKGTLQVIKESALSIII